MRARPPAILIRKKGHEMSERKCSCCGKKISGHPNKKFCNQRCKDRHHNTINPRGYGARNGDGGLRDYMDTVHPFSDEAFRE